MFQNTRSVADGVAGEALSAFGKASPPIAVTASVGAGLTLQDWVLIATLAYTLLQAAHLIYKFFKERREERAARGGNA